LKSVAPHLPAAFDDDVLLDRDLRIVLVVPVVREPLVVVGLGDRGGRGQTDPKREDQGIEDRQTHPTGQPAFGTARHTLPAVVTIVRMRPCARRQPVWTDERAGVAIRRAGLRRDRTHLEQRQAAEHPEEKALRADVATEGPPGATRTSIHHHITGMTRSPETRPAVTPRKIAATTAT
jgi:hypothetical protein